ncbi:MAG: energy-coupled thiamine transporter ThiT [Muribaculaceae bacterium]|nr:energy-coupled thiamine transporter ThiT [Roseburia sp.]MCM1431344.1 energy-coupled thiamine transporter ThiT [Muribaculaceae bacterium]MCM1491786.1 energy-coupled thiamine transporter ThiT [Muribaculaceae bacterium]
MSDLFVTTEGAWDDGSVRMTALGIGIVIALILTLIIVAAVLRQRKSEKKAKLTTKQLVFSAVAMALAIVCSMIKFADLPMGGSITLFSMLFIVLIGYWYGPYVGLMTGIAYGLLQFVMEPIFYTVPQMLTDYPLAFGALGLSGFFYKKKWGLQTGYIVGVIGRYIFAVISGFIFFGSYAPEGMHPLVYSLGYNATYIVPEAVVTLIIISIPPIAKALAYVRKQAVEEKA